MRALNSLEPKAIPALIFLALLLSFVPLCVYAGEDVAPDFSSVGRAFTKQEIAEQVKNGGLVRIVDRSDVNCNVQPTAFDATLSTNLPSKVDIRENGTVTPVKNQNMTGTCWAFGFVAAAETTIANVTSSSPTDFSAYQLAYFAFDPLAKDKTQLIGSEVSQSGEGLHMKEGLDAERFIFGATETTAASMLMQGCGIALDSSIAFPESALTTGIMSDSDRLATAQRRESVARLSKFSYLGSIANTSKDASGNTVYVGVNDTVLARVKSQVASGNAATISYYGDDPNAGQDRYIAPVTYAQYTYEYKNDNHVVCVVGYDDTYSKDNFLEGHQPPADGAFIVKNSWGSGWGLDGYFYLSYYDQSLSETFAVEFDVSDYDGSKIDENEEIVDQYDYLQANVVLAYKEDDPAWYSNVFTSSKKQQLHTIATYICDDNVELTYKVYKLKSDAKTPLDVQGSLDAPDAAGTYTSDFEGYVTIELEEPINLAEGEKYAIVLSQDTLDGKSVAPVPLQFHDSYTLYSNYGANTVINVGESFYSSDASTEWKSWTTTHVNGLAYDNYCAKGYATSMVGTPFVMFNTQGGSTVPTQAVKVGGVAKEPEAPTREGYVFGGWFTDSSCTKTFEFTTEISDAVTLWAKWEAVAQPDEVVQDNETTTQVSNVSAVPSGENQSKSTGALSETGDDCLIDNVFFMACFSGTVMLVSFFAKRRRR